MHDARLRLKIAIGPGKAVSKSFATADDLAMIAWVKDFAAQHGAVRIVLAYEASGQRFGLYDVLTDAGMLRPGAHASAPYGAWIKPRRARFGWIGLGDAEW